MKHNWKNIATVTLCLMGSALEQTSCDIIDDDLSDCGKDYTVVYRMQLMTNMDDELNHVLDAPADLPVSAALRQELSTYFSDYGRDLDVSFYLTTADEARRHHAQHQMNGREGQYTYYLAAEQYRNLVVANAGQEPLVALVEDTLRQTARLQQERRDTIDGHTSHLFTGRTTIDVPTTDTTIVVPLYMANAAVALVCDTTGYEIRSMQVFVEDMATSFSVSDSTYAFDHSPVVRTVSVQPAAGKTVGFYARCFPSGSVPTRAYGDPEGSYYRVTALVGLADGTVTRNVIYVYEPLRAGCLKVIKTKMDNEGAIEAVTAGVGVSVTLDWKPGGEYNPEL